MFLVPDGERPPGQAHRDLLMRHLEWAQKRYQKMLRGRGTFSIARQEPEVLKARRSLEFYRKLPKGEDAGRWAGELLEHFQTDRFTCPYVFVVIVMNPRDRYPVGGGRPLNGGINTGGGIVVASSSALTKMPNFQSTLQHELGHAFGLPHVDVYGYDMRTNRSIMSYNPDHKTSGLRDARTPGVLIPEDLRALALNDRAFPELEFDPAGDIPAGAAISPRIVTLGPMDIPGQIDYAIRATTESAKTFGSSVKNIVQNEIKPSQGPGVTFDRRTMWHSGRSETGWVSAEIGFPVPVELTRVAVHSQHSGKSHAARRVRIQSRSGAGWSDVTDEALDSPDDVVSFKPTRSADWKFHFEVGPSRQVVIRGLRFFAGEDEIFPQRVPYSDDKRKPGPPRPTEGDSNIGDRSCDRIFVRYKATKNSAQKATKVRKSRTQRPKGGRGGNSVTFVSFC